jgi:WYL domain
MPNFDDIGWGVTRRFEFIEWRAYWDGRLNRGDLEREFNISTPQASVDLRNYREAAPGNIEYNATDKVFVATANFRPMFLRLSPERYLLQLHSIKTGGIERSETWFGDLPPVDVLAAPTRGPEAYTLRAVLKAIRMGGEMDINYQSLTSTRMRTICPHSLAHDGHRWHVRAWAPEHAEFRDYVLGRILSFSNPKPCASAPPDDVEWHSITDLVLIPHPKLKPDQKAAIERDYRMEGGERTITLRLALAFYFIRRHNLDLRDGQITPERAQIFVKNYKKYQVFHQATQDQAKRLSEEWRMSRTQAIGS